TASSSVSLSSAISSLSLFTLTLTCLFPFLPPSLAVSQREIMSSAQQRLAAVSSSLSHPKGLLAGDVAIITGAAQGIGRSCALLFAKEGAKVVVSDLDQQKAQKVVDEIKQMGGQAVAVGGDVTADGFAKKLIEESVAYVLFTCSLQFWALEIAEDESLRRRGLEEPDLIGRFPSTMSLTLSFIRSRSAFGSIEHIVNNMLHTMSDDNYELMLKVHNVAPFKIVREAAPYLRSKDPKRASRNRSIVNISSVAGLHGNVGQANYATAKAGITGLTKTIAKEWGPFGVRCNTVAFGHILTRLTQAKELGESITVNGQKIALGIPTGGKKADADKPETYPHIPLNRPGTAEEAAQAVLFLCSPLAAYVSGHTLEATGGMGI
ncbi:hypothetical protein BMF94_5404, partial [Rhodotorula taiwanensis]